MASDEDDLKSQSSEIRELIKTPLKKGDKWYLVDSKWFKQWKKYVGYDSWDSFSVGQSEAYPGPIDNSSILEDTTGMLKEHLIDELDYQLLPKSAWEKLCNWYSTSEGQVPIQREVIEQGMFVKHCKIEVYGLDLNIRQKNCDGAELIINMSRSNTIGELQEIVRQLFSITENYTLVLYYKHMSNTYEELTKFGSTLQDAAVYTGQVIAFEAFQDKKLIQTPFIPIKKEDWDAKWVNECYKISKEKTMQERPNARGEETKKKTESKGVYKSKNQKKIKKFLKQPEKKECKTEDKLDSLEEQTRTKPESNFQKSKEEESSENNLQKTVDKMGSCKEQTRKKTETYFQERQVSGLCEPCFRGNKESVSTRWCLDCNEPLCSVCDTAHRVNKTSISHTTVVKETITNVSATFVQIEKLCKNHPDIEVGFYCNGHSVPCCINCILELHRNCDSVISLDDAAKTIEKSSSFNKITEEIECILESLENLQHDFKNNISNIQQDESVKNTVAQLKSKIVDHLNNLEKDILSQLLIIKENVVSNINGEIVALNPFVHEMKSIKADLAFMIEHSARKHAFLLCHKLKEEMEAKHVRLTEMISSYRHFNLLFEPSVQLDQLKAKMNSFGVITVKEEPKQIADKRHTSAQGNVVTNQ